MIREFKHERTARNGCMTEAKDSALSIVGMHLIQSVGALSIKQRQEMNSGTRAGWLRAWVIKPDRVGTCRDSVVVVFHRPIILTSRQYRIASASFTCTLHGQKY